MFLRRRRKGWGGIAEFYRRRGRDEEGVRSVIPLCYATMARIGAQMKRQLAEGGVPIIGAETSEETKIEQVVRENAKIEAEG